MGRFAFLQLAVEVGERRHCFGVFARERRQIGDGFLLLSAQAVDASLFLLPLALVIRDARGLVFVMPAAKLGEVCSFAFFAAHELVDRGRFGVAVLAQGVQLGVSFRALPLE